MTLHKTLKRSLLERALWAADRLGVNWLLRYKNRRTPVTVMYHGVTDAQRSDLNFCRHVTISEFDSHLAMLKKQFTIVSAREWTEAIRHPSSATDRLLTITFDDGYENNLTSAVPILRSHNLTACFFISTGLVMSGTWFVHDLLELAAFYSQGDNLKATLNDQEFVFKLNKNIDKSKLLTEMKRLIRGEKWADYASFARQIYESAGSPTPPDEYRQQYSVLTPSQVRQLVQCGMEVGSHTVGHVFLDDCSDEELSYELVKSAQDIEQMSGIPVAEQIMAYPNSLYDQRVLHATRGAGYYAAFAVGSHIPADHHHLYELPRICIGRNELISANISGLLSKLKRMLQYKK